MKSGKQIIKILVLIVALVLLMNPGILPVAEETVNAIKTEMANNVGSVLGNGTGIFSLQKLIPALSVIVLMWLVGAVILLVIDTLNLVGARSVTVAGMVRSVVKYACVLIAVIWALNIMGVNLAAIFASLGVLTLIIGFGAQSLIEDMVTGVFIIFEGNYNVGDVIVLDEFRGTVKRIGIRTTTMEDTGGNLKIINNSEIRNIQNRSKELSLAICDIGITYEADIRKVEEIILPKLGEIYKQNVKVLKSVPKYMGVQELGDSAVVLRFAAQCAEPDFFAATRLLNREMKILFDDNNIGIPYPHVEIVKN